MATTTTASANTAAETTEEKEQGDATYVLSEQEKRRFEKVFSKDAKEKMAAYLTWRKEHHLGDKDYNDNEPSPPLVTDDNYDAQLWKWAVQKAWKYQQQQQQQQTPEQQQTSSHHSNKSTKPRSLRKLNPFQQNNRHRILHVLAARLDLDVGDASLYSTALALYLDGLLGSKDSRQDNEATTEDQRSTLLLDVRPGRGWRNPPALELVGLIRHAATYLHDLYPDRLHCCVLYPVPRPAIWIWNCLIRVFLDDSIKSAVCLYPGGASNFHSPIPRQELLKHHVDEACLDHCEQARVDTFDHV
eukprot:scaffold1717_cov169-Amphora_coffeaeformis.AAC.4